VTNKGPIRYSDMVPWMKLICYIHGCFSLLERFSR
jgi:hypothetical protein